MITDPEFTNAIARMEHFYDVHLQRPPRPTPVDALGYGRWTTDYYTLRASGRDHEAAIREVERRIAAVAGLPDPWPPPIPDPIPPPPVANGSVRPINGRLQARVRSGFFDARGPVAVLMCHHGYGLGMHKRDRAKSLAWLDQIAGGLFNGVRIFATTRWQGGMAINPIDTTDHSGAPIAAWPDYYDQLRSLLDEARLRQLVVDVSFGDFQMWNGDDGRARAFVRSVGKAIREWGHQDTVGWFQLNEPWMNLDSADPDRVRGILRGMSEELPGTLWGLGASPSDNGDEVKAWRAGVPLSIIHLERVSDGPDYTNIIRRTFSHGYSDGDQFVENPKCQTEPKGQGTSVGGTTDSGGIALAAVVALGTNQPYTWICGAGIWGHGGADAGVSYPGTLPESAGWREVQALVARMPAGLANTVGCAHGGRPDAPIYQEGGYYGDPGVQHGAGRVDSFWSTTHVGTVVHHVEHRRVDRLKARVPLGKVTVYSAEPGSAGQPIAEDHGRIPAFSQRAFLVAERA